MRQSAISINNLYKSFGNKEVIHDLSFDVKEGEIFAFLGANGSGKTTHAGGRRWGLVWRRGEPDRGRR